MLIFVHYFIIMGGASTYTDGQEDEKNNPVKARLASAKADFLYSENHWLGEWFKRA